MEKHRPLLSPHASSSRTMRPPSKRPVLHSANRAAERHTSRRPAFQGRYRPTPLPRPEHVAERRPNPPLRAHGGMWLLVRRSAMGHEDPLIAPPRVRVSLCDTRLRTDVFPQRFTGLERPANDTAAALRQTSSRSSIVTRGASRVWNRPSDFEFVNGMAFDDIRVSKMNSTTSCNTPVRVLPRGEMGRLRLEVSKKSLGLSQEAVHLQMPRWEPATSRWIDDATTPSESKLDP